MRARNFLVLALVGALFGSSFIGMRIAVPEMGPLVLAEVRVVTASLVLAAFLGRRRMATIAAHWRPYLALGFVGVALPFTLVAAAEQWVTASHAAVLNATVPAFTVIVGALWLGEPVGGRKVAGVMAGIAGVAVLTGLSVGPRDDKVLLGVAAMVVAALAYAIAVSYVGARLQSVEPLATVAGQLIFASMLLVPAAIASPPQSPLSVPAVASVLWIAIPGTAVAWPLMFRLATEDGPAVASTVTFLAPAFGLLMGTTLLGETIGSDAIPGVCLVALSVVLISAAQPARQIPTASPLRGGATRSSTKLLR